MKRLATAFVAVIAVGCVLLAPSALAASGNGLPNGPHFNLNIHGVTNGQGFNGNNQNDIFVPLQGSCKINLIQSFTYDFQVLDPNCADKSAASFTLPAPCAIDSTSGLCASDTTYYSVWARALGKPGGHSDMKTCGTDPTLGDICSINAFVSVQTRDVSNTGKPKASDVSSDLLFLTTCVSGKTVSTPLFSPKYENYWWEYDNYGLKLLQLRFYQVGSPVPVSQVCS